MNSNTGKQARKRIRLLYVKTGMTALWILAMLFGTACVAQAADVTGGSAKITVAAFFDSNENGTRGIYERSVTGVTVEALPAADASGAAVASAITDASGEAELTGLAAGDYVLRFTLPDGYLYTTAVDGWNLQNSCVGDSQSLQAVSKPLTLADGETAEAGVGAIPVGSFSGKAWNDLNNDGVMQADEPGAPDITLTLTGVKSGLTYTLSTDDTGAYLFPLLRNDTYDFTATLPTGYLFARYTKTGGDSRSVFTTAGASATRQFIVTGAENVTNKNVGIVTETALSGVAFLDQNYNGVYDQGEPPYAGVTVELIKNSNDVSMGKVVTSADGTYLFASLRGGDYRLRAILPDDGSIFTIVPTSAQGLFNQFAAREGRREDTIPSIVLKNGDTAKTCVGIAMGGVITGTVFFDQKYDGVMNDSDAVAPGVKVQLTDAAGEVAATDTTNANGVYKLEGIMPGVYTVRFQRKDGYAFSRYRPDEKNSNDVRKLAGDGYGETDALTVSMGQNVEQINAGMLPSSTLSGVFFDDLNDNGLRDADEPGFTDGSVRLLSQDGEVDLTVSVAEDGAYFFDGVMPGTYTVTFQLPDNAALAKVADGGNTLEAQGTQNTLGGLTVEAGKAYEAPLVGAVTLGTFTGVAYHDQNGNGARDDGEETLSGVLVSCAPSAAGQQGGQAFTGEDGAFAITGLRPGTYSLMVQLPDGYIFSGNLTQSGIALSTDQQATVACPWAALTNRVNNAIGAVKPATVSASMWLDENRDGKHTNDERSLSGLSFQLYDETEEEVVKTATSDDSGVATFANVRPATYAVRVTLPAKAQSAQAGSIYTLSGGVNVTEGQTVKEITDKLVCTTSIGGTVALDETGTRAPQANVKVSLYQGDAGQPLQTATTDEQGAYSFDGLWPGDYRLMFAQPDGAIFIHPDDANYSAGASAVVSVENNVGESDTLTLKMAQDQLSVNAILIRPARVGDQVWLDTNRNGLVDYGEPTINGVTVQLLYNGNVAYETVSNAWGYYEMNDVYPGTYTLRAKAYPALAITKTVPSLRMISSCLTSGNGDSAESDPFSVESGSKNFDCDLGYILPDGAKMPAQIVSGTTQQWPTAVSTGN